MPSRAQSHTSERLPRPSSNSSRSAWQDDGLDAPGRPSSSSTEGGSVNKAEQTPTKTAEKKRKIISARKNCCARFIDSIWSTKHTQDLMDKEQKAKTMLRELIIYCIFLAIISTIIFSMSSSTMFTMTKVMMDLFVHAQFRETQNTYDGMLTQTDFWRFAEGPLMDGLYWETYYNGRNVSDSDLGYIYHENKLLGVPRIRQLRVKNDSCKVYTVFEKTIESCYGSYSKASNDDSTYGLGTETAWVYHTEKEMNGTNHRATIKTYPGAGFYRDLSNTRAKSMQMIQELKENQWLDRGTRVVFIDFTVFNPNVNLFCVTRMVVEFPPTGGAVTSYKFSTVKLLRYVTIGDFIIMGCEIVFCVFILYYFVEEAIELKRLKLTYFQEFWNVMDIAVIILSVFCISFNVYRVTAVEKLLDSLLRSPDQYADFYDLAYWQFHFNYGVAFMVFIAWVKLFKYISFNKTMTQLTDTIYSAKGNLAGFMVMFMVVYIAFAQLGYLFFGDQIYDFKTVPDAIMTLFRIILGDFNFAQLSEAHSILGPLYFIGYIVLVFLVLFNMFLAIINDSYSEVKAATADAENEFEVFDFFKSQYKKVLSKLNVKRDRLADIQDALAAADANNDAVIEYEEWKAELLLRGYKEDEIEEAFQKFDVDGNRQLDSNEQALMLKALEDEKKAVDMDIGEVEHKLGVNERPKTSRAKTGRSRTARTRAGTAKADDEKKSSPTKTSRHGKRKEKLKVISEVGYGEFSALSRRVDRMEHSIGNIVSKIDTVLVKLEGMERAKLKRREAMTQLLDQIAVSEDTTEEERRLYMERLVREELERWDNESAISRPGTSMSRPGTGMTRPGTSKSIR